MEPIYMYCGIFLHSVVTLRHLSHFVIHIMLHLGEIFPQR